MTDQAPDPADDGPADLAAELALGVLDGSERAQAERRVLSDPAFAQEVEAWRWRLAALAEQPASRPAPEVVWVAIETRLDEATGAGVVELRLRRAVRVWRSVAAGACAAAAALAVALAWPRPAPAPAPAPVQPLQTASLSGAAGGTVAFVAVLDPTRRVLVLTPATIASPGGRAPQLWVIPTGGKPMSLGVAAFGRAVRLPVDAALGVGARRTLAVSLEPQGGSPTGQPTGPVVATGELKAL